jgi:HK97 gp10 family phage protein
VTITITGIGEVERILSEIAPRHAGNLMRATVLAVAGKVRDEARQNAPVATGKLKKAIKSKRKKSPPDEPRAEVFVQDAYYWRFVEYGTVKRRAQPFLLPAKEKVDAEKERILVEEFGKKLERALARASR